MVLSIGLKAAEKMANSYIADLKPSINSEHTTWKISEVFPESIKPLLETLVHEVDYCTAKPFDEEHPYRITGRKHFEGINWWDEDRH